MVNDKLIAVDEETHKEINSLKLCPRDAAGDCLKRVLADYKRMKASLTSEGILPGVDPSNPTLTSAPTTEKVKASPTKAD